MGTNKGTDEGFLAFLDEGQLGLLALKPELVSMLFEPRGEVLEHRYEVPRRDQHFLIAAIERDDSLAEGAYRP
jgi:hypothetical protein